MILYGLPTLFVVIMLTAQGKTQGDLDCPNGQEDYCRNDDDNASDYLQDIPPETFAAFSSFFKNETLTNEVEGMRTLITGDESLCDSRERILFPRKARAIDNEFRHIVNAGKYMQGVRVELCLQNRSPCRFSDSFPSGYSTVCKQKFLTKELVTFDPKNPHKALNTNFFLFPACCVCNVLRA